MLKKDSLTAQMQLLSHQLAKTKRLMVEAQWHQAMTLIHENLLSYYQITLPDLLSDPGLLFLAHFNESQKSPEALSLLADFLEEAAHATDDVDHQYLLYRKIVLLYQHLEAAHRVISFDKMHKQIQFEQWMKAYELNQPQKPLHTDGNELD
jgi:hypothetical protein